MLPGQESSAGKFCVDEDKKNRRNFRFKRLQLKNETRELTFKWILGKQSELRKSPWLIIIPSFQTEEIVILILITSFMVSSTVQLMQFEGRKTEEDFTSWIGVTRPYKQFSEMLQRFFTHVASIYANLWEQKKEFNSHRIGLVGTQTWSPFHCFHVIRKRSTPSCILSMNLLRFNYHVKCHIFNFQYLWKQPAFLSAKFSFFRF